MYDDNNYRWYVSPAMQYVTIWGNNFLDKRGYELRYIDIPDYIDTIICYYNNIKEIKLTDNINNITLDIFTDLDNINNNELVIEFW